MSAPGMAALYDDRGAMWRNWLSTAVLIGALIWGVVEIVRAQMGASDSTGFLFGIGFLVAAAYGAYKMLSDARDTIVRLEADRDGGQSVVTLWRPWGPRRLEAPLGALRNWRMYVAIRKRNQPTYLLRVDHPFAGTLHIELRPEFKAVDGLRQLAPEAIEEFEIRTGRRKAG